MVNKNKKLLIKFTEYCKKHPELRFWQALRSWAEADFIIHSKSGLMIDTYYWENKLD